MSLQDHAAAGSAAAFVYQFERALVWLSASPSGARIGIETTDDVARIAAGGAYLSEQDKHTITNAKPFGNRSKDLWNTLAIWVEAIHGGELPAGTAFRMVTNASLAPCLAHTISAAQTDAEIAACIEQLAEAAKDPPQSIKDQVAVVLDPARRVALQAVIKHCELLDGRCGTNAPELRAAIAANLQLPKAAMPHAEAIVNELRGWLTATVLGMWQSQKPGWVERDNFINYVHSILGRLQRIRTRERAERLIPVSDVQLGQKKASRFVRQMHLVTDDALEVDNAIRDFIRCHVEKIRLSAEGDITDEDWLTFRDALSSRWDKIRRRVVRMRSGHEPKNVGYEIFTETTENHRERLAGSETDQVYLTAGTYHDLSDALEVGWHPEFKKILGG